MRNRRRRIPKTTVLRLWLFLCIQFCAGFSTTSSVSSWTRVQVQPKSTTLSAINTSSSNGDLRQQQQQQQWPPPRTNPFTVPTSDARTNNGVSVLSQDPLIYVIPNLLSNDECEAYIARIQSFQQDGSREMTLSNPPEVSLQLSKLWPLPLLSLLAGLPPYIRLQQAQQSASSLSIDQILSAVVPPIGMALLASLVLAFAVVLPLIRQVSSTSSRTSEAIALNLDDDVLFCRSLVERVSLTTNHPWHAWEAPVVTRYEPGAIFARHGDASPTGGAEWADLGGQRVVTCICYLNTLQEGQGGETMFDQLGIDVSPQQGNALVFFPADIPTLQADPRTTHESLPPLEEKWIVQMFGRIGPRVPPPLGLPDSYGNS